MDQVLKTIWDHSVDQDQQIYLPNLMNWTTSVKIMYNKKLSVVKLNANAYNEL